MKAKVNEIAKVLGIPAVDSTLQVSELLTDSRSLRNAAESLFFALKTHSGDGHQYIKQLYDRGVRLFVVSELSEEMTRSMPQAVFLKVDDTLKALQRIGASMPVRPACMVAVTGSRGKTLFKEWTFQTLEETSDIVRSPRSWNSSIGVPLSLWQIEDPHQLAIIEAGVSKTGEMNVLADMINPDIVVITDLTVEHEDGFNSMQQKADEKAILAANAKTVIYNLDCVPLRHALEKYPQPEKISFSQSDPQATLLLKSVEAATSGVRFNFLWRAAQEVCIEVPASLEWHKPTLSALVAFLLNQGLSPHQAARACKAIHIIGTRLNVTDGVNHCSLITDSFTNDISSLAPALDFAKRRLTPGRSLTLVLSDLHHNESSRLADYQVVAEMLSDFNVNRFIGVGPEIANYKHLFPSKSLFFHSGDEMAGTLSPSDFADEVILLKGSSKVPLSAVPELLEARKHETVLEVNLDALVRNYNYFRRHLPQSTGLIAMVKASGYGAGSYEIAKTLQAQGASYLAVAVLDEGIELRRRGISMPIMVMNPKVANYRAMFANRLEPEIYSMEMLDEVIAEAQKNGVLQYPVHIKLDTGMHRMGFIENELDTVVEKLKAQQGIIPATLFSHLATADCPDMDEYTSSQLDKFERFTNHIIQRWGAPIKRHVLNSAGILRYASSHHYDFARLGIGLYGVNTLPPEMERPLDVVSTLRTPIIAIRKWNAGESIGYGRKGILSHDATVATIPIGYADGMNRHYGRGNAQVWVNGRPAPTIGNICMDACMIDITGIDCHVGDSVEIFGTNAPIQRLADILDTIPYEVLTSVSPRVKRIYFRE